MSAPTRIHTAKDRLEGGVGPRAEGIGRPLSAAEVAFFDQPDREVKPTTNERTAITPSLSESAMRVALRNLDISEAEIDMAIEAARSATPPDMRVEPEVRGRLNRVLYEDPRFNGSFGNGVGYSEFITRALNALGCGR